ncbi:MAG: hypothetical protein V3R30_15185, partial [Kiloniellales bacterium]
MLAEILKLDGDLFLDLTVDGCRDKDLSRLTQPLDPRSHVHPVAVYVVVVDDDVANIYFHPKFNAAVFRNFRTAQRHSLLDIDSVLNGIHGAWELDQDSIAGRLEDPPAVLLDLGIEQLLPECLELRQGARLVFANKPAVS